MVVVLAPAGAAYAGQAGADHDKHPCVTTECADGPGTGGATGGAEGRMSIVATGPTSFPYLAIAGGLVVAGVAAIVVSRVRTRLS
ncbi:hypothetical protein ACQEVI_08985 [Promicromonospora sp. CA-289599]|uniref:hypothetical protein n=1 Tax=Promicromonospora sp. CA-289599 TaxID=3240014 RepID=UPI003D8D420D